MYLVKKVGNHLRSLLSKDALKNWAQFIENTLLVSFDTKFIRRDQKEFRNGEAYQTVLHVPGQA